MRKILVIAAREYKAAVRTKAFVVTLLLMPMLMFGSAGVQVFLDKQSKAEDKTFAVVDRTPGGELYAALKRAADLRNEKEVFDPETGKQVRPRFLLERVTPSEDTEGAKDRQRLELSDQVRANKYWGFIEIGSKAMDLGAARAKPSAAKDPRDPHAIRYQTNHPTFEEFPSWAEKRLLSEIVSAWFQKQFFGLIGRAAAKATQDLETQPPPTLNREGLSQLDANGNIIDPPAIHQIARFLLPAVLVLLMFMMIMLSSTPAMSGVVEEKMQRIAEVLLGSVTPFQLMLGKLTGLIGVSLTAAAVYLGGVYWAAHHYGFTEFLPLPLLLWYIVFQSLAVLMYGSLFLAIGAAATDTKETQTLVMPVLLLAVLPMFVLRNALEDPNSPIVVGASFFPPVTPMLMMARLAIQPGPVWWQPLLGMILVLAVTLGCVWAAGRIFRIGILMQGKAAKLSQMIEWVIRG